VKTILVVDDRPEARYATARILESAGYDVRETASGHEALRLARLPPDLIVLDVALPDIDGFEVCWRLKQDQATAAIPVVHKSAVYLDPGHRQRGLAVGAHEYLTEPLDRQRLLLTVRQLVG
jgi:CheY-like chemotaxis protein